MLKNYPLQIKNNHAIICTTDAKWPTKKDIVTQNLRRKLSEIAPGTTVRIRTDEQNLWGKKGIVVSQNNCPLSYHTIFEQEREYISQKPSSPDTSNPKTLASNMITSMPYQPAAHLLIRI